MNRNGGEPGSEADLRGSGGGGEKRGYGEGGGWVTGELAAGEDAGSERGGAVTGVGRRSRGGATGKPAAGEDAGSESGGVVTGVGRTPDLRVEEQLRGEGGGGATGKRRWARMPDLRVEEQLRGKGGGGATSEPAVGKDSGGSRGGGEEPGGSGGSAGEGERRLDAGAERARGASCESVGAEGGSRGSRLRRLRAPPWPTVGRATAARGGANSDRLPASCGWARVRLAWAPPPRPAQAAGEPPSAGPPCSFPVGVRLCSWPGEEEAPDRGGPPVSRKEGGKEKKRASRPSWAKESAGPACPCGVKGKRKQVGRRVKERPWAGLAG
uniref:Uncharacterized protein n=1 Tax=Setaria viridis TaxID=4556 RepID=A0A4U6VC03_SETVI|nr:hypothetical protein SEVIR_3G224600v2 [Setaria viridis]